MLYCMRIIYIYAIFESNKTKIEIKKRHQHKINTGYILHLDLIYNTLTEGIQTTSKPYI